MAVDTTSTQLTLAELYEITLSTGAVAYFTSHDANITYDAQTWQAIPIGRSNIAYHNDLQVDKVEISVGIVGVTIGATLLTIPQIIKRDYLRNAHVRVLLVDYEVLDSEKLLFEGWITGAVSYNAGILTASVGSILDKLNNKFPKVIYSETCNHTLFSTACGLTKSSYLSTGACSTASDQNTIYSTIFNITTAYPQDYWLRGEIKFTSGSNQDIQRTIASHSTAGSVTVMVPFPETVAGSDAFDAYPGCDKTGAMCSTRFNNYANFFGFEFIPKPELIMY